MHAIEEIKFNGTCFGIHLEKFPVLQRPSAVAEKILSLDYLICNCNSMAITILYNIQYNVIIGVPTILLCREAIHKFS